MQEGFCFLPVTDNVHSVENATGRFWIDFGNDMIGVAVTSSARPIMCMWFNGCVWLVFNDIDGRALTIASYIPAPIKALS